MILSPNRREDIALKGVAAVMVFLSCAAWFVTCRAVQRDGLKPLSIVSESDALTKIIVERMKARQARYAHAA